MADPNNPGEKLSTAGIRLRRDETALAALTLAVEGASKVAGNRGCFVLTDQRMFHISGPSAVGKIKTAPLQDVGDAELAKQPRYHVFLLPAGYFLVIGFAYFIATAIAGAFQPIVLVPTLLLGGGFLALWWYSGGDLVLRMKFGDAQLEGVIDGGLQREGFAFLEQLTEIMGKNDA